MNADQLPLNEPLVFAQTEVFRAVATRISENVVEVVYYDQPTNDKVLTMHGGVDGMSNELVSFDKFYWKVIINGRPATEQDVSDLMTKKQISLAIDPSVREIKATVRA